MKRGLIYILVLIVSSTTLLAQDINSKYSSQESQQTITLRTNLLYWLTGMVNVGVEWQPNNSQIGLLINGGYSPFGDDNWEYALGGWYVAPELRYYIPSNERWFVGAQFLAQGYNVKLSDTGYQGDLISGGVMGGYKLTLNDHFDMDFTLGVGYGTLKYDTYYHSDGFNIYKQKSLTKSGIVPIQAGVNLIWKIE